MKDSVLLLYDVPAYKDREAWQIDIYPVASSDNEGVTLRHHKGYTEKFGWGGISQLFPVKRATVYEGGKWGVTFVMDRLVGLSFINALAAGKQDYVFEFVADNEVMIMFRKEILGAIDAYLPFIDPEKDDKTNTMVIHRIQHREEDQDGHTEWIHIIARDEATAMAYLHANDFIPSPNSPYDCTGQAFTTGIDMISSTKRYEGGWYFIFEHKISLDV